MENISTSEPFVIENGEMVFEAQWNVFSFTKGRVTFYESFYSSLSQAIQNNQWL